MFLFSLLFFAFAKQWKQRKIGNSKIKNSIFFFKKVRSNGWRVFMSHCIILVWRRFLAFQQFRPLTKRNPWYFCGCLSWHMQKPIHIMKSASRQRQRKATRSSPSSAYQKRIKPYKRLFSLRLIGGINILKYIIEHVTMCTRHQSLITSRFRMPKIVHKWTTRFLWFPVHDFLKSHTIQIERTFE